MGNKVIKGSKTWKERYMDVCSQFTPEIYQCKKCGSPYPSGYVCFYCNTDNSALPPRPN
jgi:hypothetical protein